MKRNIKINYFESKTSPYFFISVNNEDIKIPVKFMRVSEMKELEKLLNLLFDLGRLAELKGE